MTYGIKVTGSDIGGEYLVTDSDQNLINYGVTQSGRASSFTLNRAKASDTFILVKNADTTATDSTFGTFTPDHHFLSISGGGTAVNFYGGTIERTNLGNIDTPFGSVAMDYAVLEKTNSNITPSGSYGIQIFTSTSAVAFDSRRLATNNSVTIDAVLPSSYSSSTNFGQPPSIAKTSSQYINLEWTDAFGGDLFAVSDINNTTVYVLDGSIEDQSQGGQEDIESLLLYEDPYFSLIIATLN